MDECDESGGKEPKSWSLAIIYSHHFDCCSQPAPFVRCCLRNCRFDAGGPGNVRLVALRIKHPVVNEGEEKVVKFSGIPIEDEENLMRPVFSRTNIDFIIN